MIKLNRFFQTKTLIFLILGATLFGCDKEDKEITKLPISFTTSSKLIANNAARNNLVVHYNTTKSNSAMQSVNYLFDITDIKALKEGPTISSWENSDKIGVCATKSGTSLSDENIVSNVRNTLFSTNGNGKFYTQQDVSYPEDDTAMDFIAYYPYAENITNFQYPIDITKQNDILYSNNLKGVTRTEHGNNTLQFQRVLAKLILTIKPKSAGASLGGLQVSLNNIRTKAQLSLVTGAVTVDTNSENNIAITAEGGDTEKKVVAYLLPKSSSQATRLVFNVRGKTYWWQLPDDFVAGKVYNYTIKLDKLPESSTNPDTQNYLPAVVDSNGKIIVNFTPKDYVTRVKKGQHMFSVRIPDGYYTSASTLSGNALRSKLREIISNGALKLSYDMVWTMCENGDENPINKSQVWQIYKETGISKSAHVSGGYGWNREHVWAKSHGDFGTSRGAGTDGHHLRAADNRLNSSRGNKNFADCSGPLTSNSSFYEPPLSSKGDVARCIFYMAVRYGFKVDNSSSTGKSPRIGKLDDLLKWNELDPVDPFEIRRNNIIFGYQKNRNPFIDHPELVQYIFGDKKSSTWKEK